MIKLVFCLHRLPGLSRGAFQSYWFDTHAPLVQRVAGALNIRGYVQSHSFMADGLEVPAAARGSAGQDYDGVAELTWDSVEALLAPGLTEAGRAAGALLLEDEKRFIDLARSPLFFVRERRVI
jgi:uncharacterized protein (TIGR02118 family)